MQPTHVTGHSWLGAGKQEKPYVHQSYPKTKFHETKDSVVVDNPEAEKQLGVGWEDTPAAFTPEGKEEALRLKREADGKAQWEAEKAKVAAAEAADKAAADKAAAKK